MSVIIYTLKLIFLKTNFCLTNGWALHDNAVITNDAIIPLESVHLLFMIPFIIYKKNFNRHSKFRSYLTRWHSSYCKIDFASILRVLRGIRVKHEVIRS